MRRLFLPFLLICLPASPAFASTQKILGFQVTPVLISLILLPPALFWVLEGSWQSRGAGTLAGFMVLLVLFICDTTVLEGAHDHALEHIVLGLSIAAAFYAADRVNRWTQMRKNKKVLHDLARAGLMIGDKNTFLIELSESERVQLGRDPFAAQRLPQKVFSSIWQVEAEVNNGGFAQYFFNSSAETAHFVAEALETIGAPQTADICRRAIAVAFPAGLPANPEEISKAAEDFPDTVRDALFGLDGEFYKYPHNLSDLLYAYVAAHPEEFGPISKGPE